MDLTSPAFFGVVVAVTVVVIAVAVVLTGRLRRGLFGALGRLVLILLVAVMAIVSVAVKLNNDNGWYASWNDLLGTPPESATQLRGLTAREAAAAGSSSSHKTAPAGSIPPLAQAASRTQYLSVHGNSSGIVNPVTVLLPASYFSGNRTYPVIEAFHGIPGSPSGWTKTMGIVAILDTAVSAKELSESIVVVPELNSPPGRDGECVNGPAGTPPAGDLADEGHPAVRRVTLPRPHGPSLLGRHRVLRGRLVRGDGRNPPQRVFGASISLGGYFSPPFGGTGPPWPKGSDLARRYDLVEQIKATAPSEAMWIQSGDASPDWPQTQTFLAEVRPPLSVTSVVMKNTGHRWDVWLAQVPEALRWLGTNIPGFAPA